MKRHRPRGLSKDDRAVWDQVARSVTPLEAARPIAKEQDAPKPMSDPSPAKSADLPVPQPAPALLREFTIGGKATARPDRHRFAPKVEQDVASAPLAMDARKHKRMVRGKEAPEARIDLHGMTLSQAQPALVDFLLTAHARGLRLVLVITGKGRKADSDGPIPVPQGVLRNQVPRWLTQAPLRAMVLQVRGAHQSHGGGGAYYVYLKRR